MRADPTERTGTRGVSEVKAELQALGWGPIDNHEHDLGTDLFVQVRDVDGFDLRVLVGVQVKTGPSYFKSVATDDAGEVTGWWYSESDGDHFDYWIGHTLPHLLVLRDLEMEKSYWAHVSASAVKSTGKGNKIRVPIHQVVDDENCAALLEVAVSGRGAPSLEGTAWRSSVDDLSPGQRYRFALLAPRLTRPPRGPEQNGAVSAVAALGLLADGRSRDLRRRAEKSGGAIPFSFESGISSKDWGWTFVAAFWLWKSAEDGSRLEELLASAPDSPRRVAAAVVAVCALMNSERYAHAQELLQRELQCDDLSPTDRAWLTIQRGRLYSELGEVDRAREDALAVGRLLVGDRDDVTVSAVSSAASSLLWQTLNWPSDGLGEVMETSDTAVSWWRSLKTATALEEASDREFKKWTDDRSTNFIIEDVLHNQLFAASVNAHLAGEHGTWRRLAGLLAQYQVMKADSEGDGDLLAGGLHDLRCSGDSKALKMVTWRVWLSGPLSALKAAVDRIGAESWTYSVAQSNLIMWEHGGDLLDESRAARAVEFCLDVLTDPVGSTIGRLHARFDVVQQTLETLRGLLVSAGDEANRSTASYISTLPGDAGILDGTLRRLVGGLQLDALSSVEIDGLRDYGARSSDPALSAVVLGRLSEVDDDASRQLLVDRASNGDLSSLLVILGDDIVLDPERIVPIVQGLNDSVVEITASARQHHHGFRPFDAVATLVRLNVAYPEVARWDDVVDLLIEPTVRSSDKAPACRVLADSAHRLPDGVRSRLGAGLGALLSTNDSVFDFPMNGDPSLVGVAERLAHAIGIVDDEQTLQSLGRLALGGRREKRDLAQVIGDRGITQMRGALSVLASDVHSEVRAAAGTAAAKLLVRGLGGPTEHLIVDALAASDGVACPSAVLRGLYTADGSVQGLADDLFRNLAGHRSATVRRNARLVEAKLRQLPGGK